MTDERPGDEKHPATQALRVHRAACDDGIDALCVFDGEYWPCDTAKLANEILKIEERRRG